MATAEILPAFSYACGMISATLSHGERVLLENVFFSLSSGERLAVIGETGSGKTMLMRSNILPDNIGWGSSSAGVSWENEPTLRNWLKRPMRHG